MYWRGAGPGHTDSLYSLATVLVFAWMLAPLGVYEVGITSYVLLALTSLLVIIAAFWRRV